MGIRSVLFFFPCSILLLICLVLNNTHAQDISHIEKRQLTKDTLVIRAMHGKLGKLWHSHPDSLCSVGDYLVRSSQAINYKAGEILGLLSIGTGNYQLGKNKEAVAAFQQIIDQAEKVNPKANLINALSNQSMSFTALGMYDRSIENLSKALKLSKEYDLKTQRPHILNNLGMVYDFKGDHDKALAYYEKCKDEMLAQKDSSNLSFVYGNIANILVAQDKDTEGRANYLRSLQLAKHFKNKKGIGYALKSLGSLSLKQNNPQEALKYCLTVRAIFEETGEKTEYLSLLELLSDVYFALDKNQLGISYLKQAFALAQQQEQLYYIKVVAAKLGERLEETGLLHEALKMQRISSQATDSLSNKDMKEKIVRIEERYQFEKELELTDEAHKKEIQKREFFIISIILLSLLGLVITFLVIKAYYRQKRYNKILKEAKEIIESKNAMLRKEDQFKDHMLSVLAHDVRSPIVAVRSLLENFDSFKLGQKQFDELLAFARKEIKTLSDFIEDILLWVKAKDSDFSKGHTSFNLSDLLTETAGVYQLKATQQAITLQLDYPEQLWARSNADIFKIIIRNLLDNAIKYCTAKDSIRIEVMDDRLSDRLKITLQDSGPGLPDAIKDSLVQQMENVNTAPTSAIGSGLGLSMCVYYASLIDVKMEVYSEKGKGTCFSFYLQKWEK